MQRPQAVLLDALGTLVELAPPGPALQGRLRAAGVEVSRDGAEAAMAAEIAYYRSRMHEGRDAKALEALRRDCAEVVRGALPPSPALDRIDPGEMKSLLLDSLRFEAYPDALAALPALRRQGLKLVVVSNWDAALEEVLVRVGLARELDGVLASAQVGAPKPAGAIFRQALALAGVSADEALHVGNSLREDVEGAKAAGIKAVLLDRSGAPPPPGVRSIASLGSLAGLWSES